MIKPLPCIIFLLLLIGRSATAQVDTAIGLIEDVFGTDHLALASALCFDQPTEKEKANAIYNWVTHNISYDVKFLRKPRHYDDKVEHALKTKKAVCEGYSELFTELCRAAGLKAVNIEGYAKDWIFDNGDEMYIPRHEWSAVRINGKWQLVDATWGAGGLYQKRSWIRKMFDIIFRHNKMGVKSLKFRFKYDTTFFMQDPEAFRLRHIPSDPLWQLTDTVMPLSVFESGDSATRSFNELYSKPVQSDYRLDRISELDEKQKLFEFADRAYAYNNRYPVILAIKNTYRAESVIGKAFSDSTVQDGDILLKDAVNDLKKSLGYIKEQKKAFPEEYNKLKKKNKTKGLEAKQSIRLIKSDDKRLIATCKMHTRSAENKSSRAQKKLAEIQKRKRTLDPKNFENIETGRITKKESSPELYAIKDSVAARNLRIDATRKDAAEKSDAAKRAILSSTELLDSLVKSIDKEDSMLRKEAMERLGMHDSYDDEVKKWSNLFKQQKYHTTDTLLKYYFAAYDTIVVRYEALQKVHVAALDMYKSNLRAHVQYKKWNNTDADLKSEYTACVNDYIEAIDSASGDFRTYIGYLEGNMKLFGMLTKQGKRQLMIVDYMERAEKSRQSLEAGSIARKRAFDVKENEKQRAAVQSGLKQLQKVVRKVEG
jgi:hypothetical protein